MRKYVIYQCLLLVYNSGNSLANVYKKGLNWVYYDNTTVPAKYLQWSSNMPSGSGKLTMIDQVGLSK